MRKCIIVIIEDFYNLNVDDLSIFLKDKGFKISDIRLNIIYRNIKYNEIQKEIYIRFTSEKEFIACGDTLQLYSTNKVFHYEVEETIRFKSNKISISAERFLI